jgi:hypothetical protein
LLLAVVVVVAEILVLAVAVVQEAIAPLLAHQVVIRLLSLH